MWSSGVSEAAQRIPLPCAGSRWVRRRIPWVQRLVWRRWGVSRWSRSRRSWWGLPEVRWVELMVTFLAELAWRGLRKCVQTAAVVGFKMPSAHSWHHCVRVFGPSLASWGQLTKALRHVVDPGSARAVDRATRVLTVRLRMLVHLACFAALAALGIGSAGDIRLWLSWLLYQEWCPFLVLVRGCATGCLLGARPVPVWWVRATSRVLPYWVGVARGRHVHGPAQTWSWCCGLVLAETKRDIEGGLLAEVLWLVVGWPWGTWPRWRSACGRILAFWGVSWVSQLCCGGSWCRYGGLLIGIAFGSSLWKAPLVGSVLEVRSMVS